MSIIASLPVLALLASAAAASHTPHTLINHVIDVLWPAGLPSMPVAVVIGDFTGELKEALSSRAVHVVPMHYPAYNFNEAIIQRRMEAFTEVLEEQPRIRAPTAASLLLCLDFAHNIPPSDVEMFLSTALAASPAHVIFSSATPGEGLLRAGHPFPGESNQSTWIQRFNRVGYRLDVVSTALLRNSLVLASQLDFSLMWVAKGCLVFQPCVIKGSLQYQSALERHAEFFSRDGLLSVEWFNRLDDATSAHFPGLQQLLIRDGIEYHRILLAPFSPGERCAADRAGTDVVSALPITVGTRLLRSYLPLIRQASAAEARALALQRLHQTVADTVDELLARSPPELHIVLEWVSALLFILERDRCVITEYVSRRRISYGPTVLVFKPFLLFCHMLDTSLRPDTTITILQTKRVWDCPNRPKWVYGTASPANMSSKEERDALLFLKILAVYHPTVNVRSFCLECLAASLDTVCTRYPVPVLTWIASALQSSSSPLSPSDLRAITSNHCLSSNHLTWKPGGFRVLVVDACTLFGRADVANLEEYQRDMNWRFLVVNTTVCQRQQLSIPVEINYRRLGQLELTLLDEMNSSLFTVVEDGNLALLSSVQHLWSDSMEMVLFLQETPCVFCAGLWLMLSDVESLSAGVSTPICLGECSGSQQDINAWTELISSSTLNSPVPGVPHRHASPYARQGYVTVAVLAVSVWPSLDPLTTAAVVERLFRVVTHLNSTAVKLCILTYSTRIEAASLSLSVHQYSAAFLALEVVAVVAPAALTHHLQGVDVALVPNTVPTLAVLDTLHAGVPTLPLDDSGFNTLRQCLETPARLDDLIQEMSWR